ncbi:MAG: hypothetical protein GC155_03910 [Alphaproteobacteria bacterium]|nr:hypothetical protein [Alphaproteobacteria bacterium]
MNFHAIFPLMDPWVKNLAFAFPAWIVKPSIWIFAVLESFHLLGLAMLGGCALILGMRMMGVLLSSVPVPTVARTLRLWFNIGVALVLGTGIVIGMSNAEKLYDSPAFLLKMLSMFAALIFSYGVVTYFTNEQENAVTPAKIWASVAANFWFLCALGLLFAGHSFTALALVLVGGVAAAAPKGTSRSPVLWVLGAGILATLAMNFLPIPVFYDAPKLDAAGQPILGAEGKPVETMHFFWEFLKHDTKLGMAGFITVILSEALRAVTMMRIWRSETQTEAASVTFSFATALWVASVWVFAFSTGVNPGTFHLVCALFLVAMGIGGFRTRVTLGAAVATLVVAVAIVTYGFFPVQEDYDTFMSINKWAMRVIAVVLVAVLGWEMFSANSKANKDAPSVVKLVGLFSLLAWITVAAGGRWIGLS